jgi:hypothetical protein
LAIALAVVAYAVITTKKKLDTDSTTNTKEEEETVETNTEDLVTVTGDTITPEQAVIESELKEILKLTIPEIKLKMLNKSIYTKLDNVNPRQTPYVNNGWFVNNGVGGRILQKGTLIGRVIDVAQDKGLLTNNEGKVFTWFKVKPSPQAVKQIDEDANILLGTKKGDFWVREDVVNLKK